MKKIVLIVIGVMSLIQGCVDAEKKHSYAANIVGEGNNEIKDSLLNIDLLDKHISDSLFLVFLLNSTCTACVVDFLDFYDKMDDTVPIVVLIQKNSRATMEYYIDNVRDKKSYKEKILLIDKSENIYKNSLTASSGTIYVIERKKIRNITKYKYENGKKK